MYAIDTVSYAQMQSLAANWIAGSVIGFTLLLIAIGFALLLVLCGTVAAIGAVVSERQAATGLTQSTSRKA